MLFPGIERWVGCGDESPMAIVRSGMRGLDRIDTEAVFAAHPFAETILRRLSSAGYESMLIGGVVRDGLQACMGRHVAFPPLDVDIATAAFPSEVRALFGDRPIVGVGEEFGVLVIVAPDGRSYEVATFRTEGDYDGRWPSNVVLVRDLAGDVARRDLTINGLAASVEGDVVDLVDGVKDLCERQVRAIGDPHCRFAEDYLRMLRAVRFSSQIDGRLDQGTAAAIRVNAAQIGTISQERIRDELLRLLATDAAASGIGLLDELGLLECILPEVTATKGVPQPEEYHPEGDVYVHTVAAVRVADGFVRQPIVKLAVLLHDIGKPAALQRSRGENMGGHCAVGERIAERVARRLRLSRQDTSRLLFLIKNHMRIADLPEMGRGKQIRFLSERQNLEAIDLRCRYPLFFDLLQVLVADCEASAHRSSGWAAILQETLRVGDHIDRVCGVERARELIDGHMLIDLGLAPGPQLGKMLDALHDRILAGELSTREEAIESARVLMNTHLKSGRSAATDGTPALEETGPNP